MPEFVLGGAPSHLPLRSHLRIRRRTPTAGQSRAVAWALVFWLVLSAAACAGPTEQRASHMKAGWAFLDVSNFEKARVEFANALKIESKDAEARYGAGRAAEGLRDYRAALGHYQAAIDANPRELRARVATARLLFFGGALDEATKHVTAALALDPRYAEALAVRGALALARSDAGAARSVSRVMIPNKPSDVCSAGSTSAF